MFGWFKKKEKIKTCNEEINILDIKMSLMLIMIWVRKCIVSLRARDGNPIGTSL